MSKRISLLCLVVLLALTLPGSALAQGPVGPMHSDTFWQASYWNNTDLSGPPVLQRNETDINYDWGAGSPDNSIAHDGFSARWTRYIDTAGGTYRFTATSDDGIRVAVDGRWVINQWSEHAVSTFTTDLALSNGHHSVVVEFYENGGVALARFSWAPVAEVLKGWRGEYFNNRLLQGPAALVRDDAAVDFNWGNGSPAPGVINADSFSARWTRTLNLAPGTYHFSMTVDDGGRLWINGHLLIDVWLDQAARTYTGDLYLPGGNTTLKMEYYENAGAAAAHLTWNGGTNPPPSTGEVVVDDNGAGFSKGGSAGSWRSVAEGYGGHLLWTLNNDRVRYNYNWARWQPRLVPGRYEVFVYIPDRYSTTGSARYWISHAGSLSQRSIDQSAYHNEWVSLGTYEFRGTAGDYLSLADVTYEPYLTRLIAFDAAKWVPR